MPSFRNVLRTTAGVIVGAVFGLISVFVVAGAISAAIGDSGGWALGFGMVMVGAPVAVAAGAVLGGWSAAVGRSSSVFKVVAGAGGVMILLMIVLSLALPDNRPKPERDADGCLIVPRTVSLEPGSGRRTVIVYDRYCEGAGGHTVNVSVAALGDRARGPGNVLWLAGDVTPGADSPGNRSEAFVTIRDSLHVEVDYDHRARVLSRASPVGGFEIAFRPSLGLPRQPASRLEPPSALRAVMTDQREWAESHAMPSPTPAEFSDADGCTISPRFSWQQDSLRVEVYDRSCPTRPRWTTDVSLLARGAPVDGPGNLLVLAMDHAPSEPSGALPAVYLRSPGPRRVEIIYDERHPIVSRGSPRDDVEITIRPGLRATGGPNAAARP